MRLNRSAGWLLAFFLLALSCAAQHKEAARNPPLSPAQALQEGRALIADLLARKPAENSTNTGTVRVRDASGATVLTTVTFVVFSTPSNWVSVYATRPADHPARAEILTVIHHNESQNEYRITRPDSGADFWVADLGLEFLHWPEPRVLRKEMRHSRPADVLEARDPHPTPGGYSRIVAWMDTDNGGVLHAEVYDVKGRLLKVFDPTGVRIKKRELEEIEMRNVQTDSHTWIKFDPTP